MGHFNYDILVMIVGSFCRSNVTEVAQDAIQLMVALYHKLISLIDFILFFLK